MTSVCTVYVLGSWLCKEMESSVLYGTGGMWEEDHSTVLN